MDCTGNVFDSIAMMGSVMSNFPFGIWDTIKKNQTQYDSLIDFIIDLMKATGITPMSAISWILSKITGVSEKVIEGIENTKDWAEKQDFQPGEGNNFLMDIENTLKYVLGVALASIPTCSANLMIGDRFFDCHSSYSYKSTENEIEGGVVLPVAEIDPFNYLRYCPISFAGKGHYSNNEKINKVSDLYKSSDFNAFLWYCKNRAFNTTQKEINKTMWDNRLSVERVQEKRNSSDWEYWLNSKTKKNYHFTDEETKLKCGIKRLKPILQIKKFDSNEPSLLFQISSQEYYRTRKILSTKEGAQFALNKTLIEFNIDYLKNIRLFNPKIIIVNILDAFLNGAYFDEFNFEIKTFIPENLIKNIIRKVAAIETSEINDCFFTFSNDEFNDALEKAEYLRYSCRPLKDATGKFYQVNKDNSQKSINDLINGNENSGTVKEETTRITQTLYQASSPKTKSDYERSELNLTTNWLEDILDMIIFQIISPIFSPQILLLISLNYSILGYDKVASFDQILKMMFSVLVSCINALVAALLKMFLEMILSALSSKVASYAIIRATEMITNYIALLTATLTVCIPGINMNNLLGYANKNLDDVKGADIVPEKTIPNSTTGC